MEILHADLGEKLRRIAYIDIDGERHINSTCTGTGELFENTVRNPRIVEALNGITGIGFYEKAGVI